MKIAKPLILTALVLAPASAWAGTITANVNGLICAFCATSIEKTLGKLDGVNHVKVDLDARTVTIDVDDAKAPSDDTISKAVTDAGYQVVDIKHTTDKE